MGSTSKKNQSNNYFVVRYRDPEHTGKTISLKCKQIFDSPLGLSFVCLSDFIFEAQGILVNHLEEELRKRFENVMNLHISIYTILSIEEKGGDPPALKFQKDKSNLVVIDTTSGTI